MKSIQKFVATVAVSGVLAGTFLAKQFEILRELLPQAQRVAMLMNPANDDYRLALAREVPMVTRLGLQVDVIEVRAPADVSGAVEKAKTLRAEGVLVLGDAIFNTPPNQVPDLLAQTSLPALYSSRAAVLAGGLMSYVPDMIAIARRHAQYADRVLRGVSPAEVPVEQPTRYEPVVNLKTAKALGLTAPPSLLSSADGIIE